MPFAFGATFKILRNTLKALDTALQNDTDIGHFPQGLPSCSLPKQVSRYIKNYN